MIFGKDVSKIPCFRNSFLYGILGGIGSGLVYFLFTSKVRVATNFGVASYAVITMSYWTQCRYKYSKTKFEMAQVQKLLREHALYEGTFQEKELDEQLKANSEPVEV